VSFDVEFSESSYLQCARSDNSSKCFCRFRTFQCKHSANESNQSDIWSWAHIDGNEYIDVVTCKL